MISTMNIFFSLYDNDTVYALTNKAGFPEDELLKLDTIATKKIGIKTQQLPVSQVATINMADRYPGIEAISLQRHFQPSYHCRLIIQLTPQALLKQHQDTSLFDGSNMSLTALDEQFFSVMRDIFGTDILDLLDLHCWCIEQISYCIDLNMLTSRNVLTYYKIIKHRIASTYKHYTEDSFHVHKPTIDDMLEKLDAYMSVKDLDNGMARLEVICKGQRIFFPGSTRDSYAPAWIGLSRDTAIYNIWHYYKRLIGFGDFYSKVKAKNIVEGSTLSNSKKFNLKLFIEAGYLSGNIASHLANFIKGIQVNKTPNKPMRKRDRKPRELWSKGSLTTYNKYRDYLLDLNLNAVPINRQLYNTTCNSYFINPLRAIKFNSEMLCSSINLACPEEYADIKYSTESGRLSNFD